MPFYRVNWRDEDCDQTLIGVKQIQNGDVVDAVGMLKIKVSHGQELEVNIQQVIQIVQFLIQIVNLPK